MNKLALSSPISKVPNSSAHRKMVKPGFWVFVVVLTLSSLQSIKSYAGNPVIFLKGDTGLLDTFKVEMGYSYKEPGDSAHSDLYGNITSSIKVTSKKVGSGSSFNILVPGVYVFNYNVTDAGGNKAVTRYRVVEVTPDKTPPNLIIAKNKVSGTDTIFYEVSTAMIPPDLKPSVRSYVISSIDLVDGDQTGSVIIDSSLVQLNVVGVYPVYYTSYDLSHNHVTVTRYVDVIDTIKPVIKLLGNNPDTIEIFTKFTDPGVSLTAPNGYLSPTQLKRWLKITGTVDDSQLGTYKITYTLTDTFGNKAITVVRTVVVADKIPPVLKIIGLNPDTLEIYTPFKDPGVQIIPANAYFTLAQLTSRLKVTGTVNDSQPGIYKITYSLTDSFGNKATVVRTVVILDNKAPVLTLLGSSPDTVEVFTPFIDPGVQITPANAYFTVAQLKSQLQVTNKVVDSVVGTYKITYNLIDIFGNKAIPVVRTVVVIDSIPPRIKLYGLASDSVLLYNTYVEPGYSVSDNYTKASAIKLIKNGTFYASFKSGYANKVGTYTIIYVATDGSGNKDSAERIVKVYNDAPLRISLKGSDSVNICEDSVYKDEGYTLAGFDSMADKIDTVGSFYNSGSTHTPGNYNIIYEVKNTGMTVIASVARSIKVLSWQSSPCYQASIASALNPLMQVKLYPNPAQQKIYIDSGNQGITNIRLINELGMVVFEQECQGKDITEIPVSQLNPGMYTVIIGSKSGTITRQVLKN